MERAARLPTSSGYGWGISTHVPSASSRADSGECLYDGAMLFFFGFFKEKDVLFLPLHTQYYHVPKLVDSVQIFLQTFDKPFACGFRAFSTLVAALSKLEIARW